MCYNLRCLKHYNILLAAILLCSSFKVSIFLKNVKTNCKLSITSGLQCEHNRRLRGFGGFLARFYLWISFFVFLDQISFSSLAIMIFTLLMLASVWIYDATCLTSSLLCIYFFLLPNSSTPKVTNFKIIGELRGNSKYIFLWCLLDLLCYG